MCNLSTVYCRFLITFVSVFAILAVFCVDQTTVLKFHFNAQYFVINGYSTGWDNFANNFIFNFLNCVYLIFPKKHVFQLGFLLYSCGPHHCFFHTCTASCSFVVTGC